MLDAKALERKADHVTDCFARYVKDITGEDITQRSRDHCWAEAYMEAMWLAIMAGPARPTRRSWWGRFKGGWLAP